MEEELERGTQTEKIRVFQVIRQPPEEPLREPEHAFFKMRSDYAFTFKNKRLQAENRTLHQLLSLKRPPGRPKASMLRSPFDASRVIFQASFGIQIDCPHDFHLITERAIRDRCESAQKLIEAVSRSLQRVIANESSLFDRFSKCVYTGPFSISLCVALFVVWLSRFVQKDLVAFIFEALMVFLYRYCSQTGDFKTLEKFVFEDFDNKTIERQSWNAYFVEFFQPKEKTILIDVDKLAVLFLAHCRNCDYIKAPPAS